MTIGRVSTIRSSTRKDLKNVQTPATVDPRLVPLQPTHAGGTRVGLLPTGGRSHGATHAHPERAGGGGGGGDGARGTQTHMQHVAEDQIKRNTSIIIWTTWTRLYVVEGRFPSVTAVQAFSQLSPPMW